MAWSPSPLTAAGPGRWRRSGGGRLAKGDDGDFLGGRLSLEEVTLREPEHPGDEHVREGLDRLIEVEDRRVVVLPREADLVLGRRQLLLEVQDVLVRLELRIVLDDREQRAE